MYSLAVDESNQKSPFLGLVGAVSLTVAEVLCCKSKVLKLIMSPDVGAASKVILPLPVL